MEIGISISLSALNRGTGGGAAPSGNFIVAGSGNRLVAGSGNPLKAG